MKAIVMTLRAVWQFAVCARPMLVPGYCSVVCVCVCVCVIIKKCDLGIVLRVRDRDRVMLVPGYCSHSKF